MTGVLIHDGRRPGQRLWTVDAVRAGAAGGAVISPFATPRVSAPRHPNASVVADDVRGAGGEVFFDPMTHAALLPNADKLDFYNQWELWGPSGRGLDTQQRRLEHVERVFGVQDIVGAPPLAPTQSLTSSVSEDARNVVATAQLASSIRPDTVQALAGNRNFWGSGSSLDAFVGALAALRAPTWILTMTNEVVLNGSPELSDVDAFVGFCRTVHSLSLRSRVIVAHSDYSGLPAIAAGADTVGSGWDRAQRTFDPLAFHVSSDDAPRIPASYVTQGGLQAVLRRSVADALERWDRQIAAGWRGGPMPPSDAAERLHHLSQLTEAVRAINSSADRSARTARLRSGYEAASDAFDRILTDVPGQVTRGDKSAWSTNPLAVLNAYTAAEGL